MNRPRPSAWRNGLSRGCGIAAWSAMLAGCATHVPQVLNPHMVPSSFVGRDAGLQPVWPQPDWWLTFDSPELSDFIARARTDNRDLAIAAAHVMEAHAETVIQRSTLFPQLDLEAQAQRSR